MAYGSKGGSICAGRVSQGVCNTMGSDTASRHFKISDQFKRYPISDGSGRVAVARLSPSSLVLGGAGRGYHAKGQVSHNRLDGSGHTPVNFIWIRMSYGSKIGSICAGDAYQDICNTIRTDTSIKEPRNI
jgi:hypothetical protein